MINNNRFVPKKRRAIDEKNWWVVWDNKTNNYSTYIFHGRYKTKKATITDIEWCNYKYSEFIK